MIHDNYITNLKGSVCLMLLRNVSRNVAEFKMF